MTQLPPATFALLQTLRSAHTNFFPIQTLNQFRPDTTDDDTDQGRIKMEQRTAMIKAVLGGWMRALEGEEGKNGAHNALNSDAITALSSSIRGSMQYLMEKPNALLIRTSSNDNPTTIQVDQSEMIPTTLEGVALGEEDLATYLLPRILRATASLEAALLSTEMPSNESTTEAALIWKSRRSLRDQLEELLVTIISVLAESAIGVEWRGKNTPVQGGIGKAREMTGDMIKLLEGSTSSTMTFPRTLSFDSTLSFPSKPLSTDGDIFNQNTSSITIKSSLHSRSLILTTTRILSTVIHNSTFLSDFKSKVVDLLVGSWPDIHTESIKGKEKVELNQDRILASTLELTVKFLEDSNNLFAQTSIELLIVKVMKEFRLRLIQSELFRESMDTTEEGGNDCKSRTDIAICKIIGQLMESLKFDSGGEGASSKLQQIIAISVTEDGTKMVDCLIGRDVSPGLKLTCLLVLVLPLLPRQTPLASITTAVELLPPNHLDALASFTSLHPIIPFALPPSLNLLQHIVAEAWKVHRNIHDVQVLPSMTSNQLSSTAAATTTTTRKRKRTGDIDVIVISSDVQEGSSVSGMNGNTGNGGKKRRNLWSESVKRILNQFMEGEDLNMENEGLESMILRLIKNTPNLPQSQAITSFKAIGLLGCARDGTLSFLPSSNVTGPSSQPFCQSCDTYTETSSTSEINEVQKPPPRIFTDTPLKGMRAVSKIIFKDSVEVPIKLAFLKTLARLLRHSRIAASALPIEDDKDPLFSRILEQMESGSRSLRMAAGNALISIVEAHQEAQLSSNLVIGIFSRLAQCLNRTPEQPAIIETTLTTIGKLARVSIAQGHLECECLAQFVSRLGHPNTYLRSLARTLLEQVATYRGIKTFALVQPHFSVISPLLINSKQSSSVALAVASECFRQPRDVLLRLTREYTLPPLILNDKRKILNQIAEASNLDVALMLTDATNASSILALLFMQRSLKERKRGLEILMGLIEDQNATITLQQLIHAVRVPLVYNLALNLGDEDESVAKQAESALSNLESYCRGVPEAKQDYHEVVLKESIIGILSHMNRGLLESTAHRPLREKQRIIRSLDKVMEYLGSAIAGFSPQIMATLQSALEVEGLREVSLLAFDRFFQCFSDRQIGPFIGTTSASYIRLWPKFSLKERSIAVKTLEFIIVDNPDGLANFVHDVADLSGIPELEKANRRLQAGRKTWDFGKRAAYLLVRIGNENDVVSLQALKELKVLMKNSTKAIQALAAGNSFDSTTGNLVKVLFASAVKDGPENEEIRNAAFECIGILGALDPDRFEMPPVEAPFVVLNNYTNHEESLNFVLHLIQNLLIGAYRTTNDTKHQEFLAYAIQELLGFCGFTVDLILDQSARARPIDSIIEARWKGLPPSVLETLSPLLGGSFSFKKEAPRITNYPIYSSTSSYREWIRRWANDLISKLKGESVKRIFGAFPPILHLEDIAVAQHLLPHLVLHVYISGGNGDREQVKQEITTVLTDQVSPTHSLSENSRLLSAQTVFDLMDHFSRWITQAKKKQQEIRSTKRKSKNNQGWEYEGAVVEVEGLLQDIPHALVGHAALTCKAYARSLLNFESHIIAERKRPTDSRGYYENLHECYADLDEPDGMEGISTKIVSPSVLHQIREHESTGRWTSAQSCWEVKLQQQPDEPANHIGLLRCLRNLGHYDSMRTHIVGILHSRNDNADWDRILAPFNIEASLIVGDWAAVEATLQIPEIEGPEVAFGKVITAMRGGSDELILKTLHDAREQLGGPIVAAGRESYRRVYDSVIHLQILHELQLIRGSNLNPPSINSDSLGRTLAARLESTSPTFRAREPILNMRRTAYLLGPVDAAREQIGNLWLETSKIARKAGHSQTAYSAILQAQDLNAPFVFVQSAKLLKKGEQTYKAIQEIDNALQGTIPIDFGKNMNEPSDLVVKGIASPLAKASLRRARWMHEAGRLEPEQIVLKFLEAAKLAPDWESPHYYIGHYWDQQYEVMEKKTGFEGLPQRTHTCQNYSKALAHGNKYIYQAMPRMLTIWLEMADNPDLLEALKMKKKGMNYPPTSHEIFGAFHSINGLMNKNAIKRLPSYQWLTVFPQLVSRVLHKNDNLLAVLETILLRVLGDYPHQAFWGMAAGAKSRTTRRSKKVLKVFTKAKETTSIARGEPNDPITLIDEGILLVDNLLALSDYPLVNCNILSMKKVFPALYRLAPTKLIIPLQSQLNVSLPSDASQIFDHKPFPEKMIIFKKFDDPIIVMTSLQKPRKISVYGDDGVLYSFLAKPKDDLRKDARLMQFNDMIIKLLKKDSESRSRRLTIRTYSVVPINEECGLIEWVPNVVVLRGVLTKLYAARGITAWSSELKKIYDTIREDLSTTGEIFEKSILSLFVPVFHEWFLETFPEPSAWLRARLAYSRTTAVISMVGFVLGLGDRHCENILLEATTGEAVHVDFNCLFDKGRTFDVGEKVPFRLTSNIIDGMGVTGVEGVYRRSSEITLRILRENKDSLMSVLETFLHDPLVEWKAPRGRDPATEIARIANESLSGVSLKLRGLQVTSSPESKGEKEVSVGEQVERLIREARNPTNLGSMYVGWCSWF